MKNRALRLATNTRECSKIFFFKMAFIKKTTTCLCVCVSVCVRVRASVLEG